MSQCHADLRGLGGKRVCVAGSNLCDTLLPQKHVTIHVTDKRFTPQFRFRLEPISLYCLLLLCFWATLSSSFGHMLV